MEGWCNKGCSVAVQAAWQVLVATETLMELIEVIRPFAPRAATSEERPAQALPFYISGGQLMLFTI